jgi:hypothetical protein
MEQRTLAPAPRNGASPAGPPTPAPAGDGPDAAPPAVPPLAPQIRDPYSLLVDVEDDPPLADEARLLVDHHSF